MRCCPRVNSQRLRITHIRQVRNQLEVVHDLAAGCAAALHTKGENTPEASLEVLLRRLVARVAFQARIRYPRNVGVALEPSCQLQRIVSMALCTKRQRLDTEEKLLCRERVQRSAVVAEDLDASADDEGYRAERVVELETVVSLARVVELREALRMLAPVELPTVDYHTANGSAVSAYPLGRRMDDDVGAVLDGPYKVSSRAECVVHYNRDASCVCDLGNLLEVGDVVFRVADGFYVDGFCVVVDGGFEVFGLVTIDELGFDAETRESNFKLIVRAAITCC